MHLTLKANEKIFINGAVLKVDRKTSLELLNDAVFLLEAHVMLEKDATTPLRQLYFIVQTMLIEGRDRPENKAMLVRHAAAMAEVYEDREILDGIEKATALVGRSRAFEALKAIRALLPVEAALIGRPGGAAVRMGPAPVAVLAEAC